MNSNARILIKLTNNIYRCTQSHLGFKMEKYQLTSGSYPYLLVLSRGEGISQNEISRELNVDKAMSARTIKKLIELGYIKKEENEDDVRAYKLYLTDKGKDVIPKIIQIIDDWTNILVQDDEENEINISLEFLEKVLGNAKKHKKDICERMNSIG